MKRIVILVLAALAVFTLALNFAPRAAAQDALVAPEPTQRLTLKYPENGIVLSGTGDDRVIYKGIVYVTVVPISPRLIKKHGNGPIFTDEIQDPEIRGESGYRNPLLPLGEYEVQFSMREGNDMKTCIKRPVILSTEDSPTLTVEFSSAKTLIIGGDHTLQQMEATISELAQRVLALQAEVDALKGKAVTPAPTETPAK